MALKQKDFGVKTRIKLIFSKNNEYNSGNNLKSNLKVKCGTEARPWRSWKLKVLPNGEVEQIWELEAKAK